MGGSRGVHERRGEEEGEEGKIKGCNSPLLHYLLGREMWTDATGEGRKEGGRQMKGVYLSFPPLPTGTYKGRGMGRRRGAELNHA